MPILDVVGVLDGVALVFNGVQKPLKKVGVYVLKTPGRDVLVLTNEQLEFNPNRVQVELTRLVYDEPKLDTGIEVTN